MLTDANEFADGQTIRVDLCIVGTGPAGSTLARHFIDRRRKVCVLESGSFERDEATQALYEGQVVGRPYFPAHSLSKPALRRLLELLGGILPASRPKRLPEAALGTPQRLALRLRNARSLLRSRRGDAALAVGEIRRRELARR